MNDAINRDVQLPPTADVTPDISDPRHWVRAADAVKALGRTFNVLNRLAHQGRIRAHRPSGLRSRYYLPDVLKFSLGNDKMMIAGS